MSEPKIRLSLKVQGAQLLSSQECEQNPKENYETKTIVNTYSKKGKLCKSIIEINMPKHKLVTQLIQLPREAFDYMSDPTNPPLKKLSKIIYIDKTIGKGTSNPKKIKVKTTVWEQMPIKLRLDWYLKKIAEHFNAKSYSFEILDD